MYELDQPNIYCNKLNKKHAPASPFFMKTLSLFGAILLGIWLYQAKELSFLIRYNLIAMMFFAFLDFEIHKNLFRWIHLKILVANCLMGFLAFFITQLITPDLAPVAFITGIMPTAIAATVIIGFLQGESTFVVVSVLVTNVGMALLLPIFLPFVLQTEQSISTQAILIPVFTTVFTPLLLALGLRKISLKVTEKLIPYRPATFYLFVFNVFLASASSSHFIRFELSGGWDLLWQILFVTFVIFVSNFVTGDLLGRPQQRLEGQQSLGRKNTMFGLWLALTFVSPIAALGPVFYILLQNTFNSYQIAKKSS